MATPWAKKLGGGGGGGSMTSDRLRPANTPRATPPSRQGGTSGGGGSGKSSGRASPEPSKSEAVKKLEALLEGARGKLAGTKRDPKGGCFCQARVHELSTYNPLCFSCGLILCNLNLPQYYCPSCAEALFTPSTRDALLGRLEKELADQLAREESNRTQAVDEARRAAGAFPTLQASPGSEFAAGLGVRQPSPGIGGLRPSAHDAAPSKVLSLTGKRATLSTLNAGRSPASSRPATPSQFHLERAAEERRRKEAEEMGSRIARPPEEVVHAPNNPGPDRPWENVRTGRTVFYVALPEEPEEKKQGGKGRKGKAKAEVATASDAGASVPVTDKKGKGKAS